MKKVQFLLILCFGLLSNASFAQTESTLYFMNSLPQVVDVNPAIMPRYKLSIGLPFISSIGASYSNNGFTYNDMISRTNGVVQADLSKFTKNLAEKNYITLSAQTDLFRVGIRVAPRFYVMASSSVKVYNRTMLERGLASLIVDGTAPIVGTYSNTAPQEEALSYIETALGMAFQVNDKLTIGGRLKYLNGINNVTTKSSSAIVQVSDTYQITATAAADVRTSGINNLNTSGYKVKDHIGDYFKNTGFGLDIGATYKFMDKLTLGISITDIGYINWKNNTYQYSLDPATAKYTFSGVDVNQLLNNNKTSFSAQLDSAKKKFEMKESASGSYSTMLPGKMYLSGNYQLINNLSVGALFFSENFAGRYSAGMTGSVNKNFGKAISTSLSYTVSNRSYNNIGMGVSFNLSPVQLYIVGDNLLRAPASLIVNQNINSYLNSSQVINVRMGLNLVFGWDKGLNKKVAVEDNTHNPVLKKNNAKVKTTFGRAPQKVKKKRTKNSKSRSKPPASKIGR